MATYFKNKKSGKVYTYIMEATDATNGRGARPVVVYSDSEGLRWVRDKDEFYEKFVMTEEAG